MKSYRNDPESEANQEATRQHAREVFALRMQARRNEDECPRCGHTDEECDCDEFMMTL